MIDVLVIGAGATGLACGHALARAGADVVVLDAAPRAGGVIGTDAVDGFLFESGPNTIPATAATFRALCGELGIAGELVASHEAARRRYLFHRGALRALPTGPLSLLRSPVLSATDKVRLATEPLRRAPARSDDEPEPTFEEFLAERIGRRATRTLAGAFVRGVYAAEVDELGARSAFPRLWSVVQRHGGLLRGLVASARASRRDRTPLPGPAVRRTALLSFPGGLGRFAGALAASLGERLRLGSPVVELARRGDAWAAATAGGETFECACVVLAVPARPAARLLARAAPAGVDVASPLEGVRHADVTVVHLGLERDELPDGFGFLVPPDERGPDVPRALGVLFPSKVFAGRAPAGAACATAVYRTADLPETAGTDERALAELARADLGRALGAPAPPVAVARARRWRDVIPRYGVGHAERMEALATLVERELPGLVLAGTYAGGVSVEDSLARGLCAARTVARRRETEETAA